MQSVRPSRCPLNYPPPKKQKKVQTVYDSLSLPTKSVHERKKQPGVWGGGGRGYQLFFSVSSACTTLDHLPFSSKCVHVGSSAGNHEVNGHEAVCLLDLVVPVLLAEFAGADRDYHSHPILPFLWGGCHSDPQRRDPHLLLALRVLLRSGNLLPHGQHLHWQRWDYESCSSP